MRKFFRFCFFSILILGMLGLCVGLGVGGYYYIQITKDLPKIERISDYKPQEVSLIYADDGKTVLAEAYEQRRYIADFNEIPQIVKQAFLAAEDASFYQHPGIDFVSILRALYVNLRKQGSVQGGSTITQQVVKSLLLTREKTYTRKAKEAILSYRLEQALSKNEIFSIYLNEIYLGSTAYGVKAASRVHFRKELGELSIAEAAFLAGLPQKPSYLAKESNRDEAITRQKYVLRQMLRNNFITQAQYQKAYEQELVIYQADLNKIFYAPYSTTHVLRQLEDLIGPKLENPGGYKIYTTISTDAYDMAERAVERGVREVDKRRGWWGPIAEVESLDDESLKRTRREVQEKGISPRKIYKAVVMSSDPSRNLISINVGGIQGYIDLEESKWAKRHILEERTSTVRKDENGEDEPEERDPIKIEIISLPKALTAGHVIEVSFVKEENAEKYFRIDQTPELEGAILVQNSLSGEIKAIVGGYDFSRSQFNRATQGLRQPGSSFKPFIYLAAIEKLGYTPATIVPDSPISLIAGNGEIWSPQNYDQKYLGPITLRTALQRSRNVVSAFMVDQIGPKNVVEVARRFGISTPLPPELSLALGAVEAKLIEMVRAYGVFSSGGWLSEQFVVKKIEDRDGTIEFEREIRQLRVVSEESAYLMANMMKGVVERGTAQGIKQLGRPVAGKTGTTNLQMDAWFIGYTPQWVAGAWVGFDVKRTIGRFETGGKAAAPIFLYFMQEFLDAEPVLDFDNLPAGIIPVRINLNTGSLTDPGDPRAFREYFISGSEPKYRRVDSDIGQDYLSSDEF